MRGDVARFHISSLKYPFTMIMTICPLPAIMLQFTSMALKSFFDNFLA